MSQDISLSADADIGCGDRTTASPRQRAWLPWALAAIVVCGYPLVLARNHTEGEDSGHYIEVVRNTNLGELFYPNHVLFGGFNWIVYRGWQLAGYAGDAALPIQLNNVLAAAAAIFLLFHIARRLGLDDFHGVLCVSLTAACYGFWWYSVEAETYILPLPFILLCVVVLVNLVERSFAMRYFFALGGCFSLAVLFHQQHVLLMPILAAAIVAAWYRRRVVTSVGSLLCGLGVFGGVSAVIVGSVYISAAIVVHDCSSFGEILRWSMGTARGGLWTPWSPANPVKSLVGVTRAVCGLHFLYGFDLFHDGVARLFPGKFLADDRLLAESISPSVRWLCVLTATGAAVSAAAVARTCAARRRSNATVAAQLNDVRFVYAIFAAGTLAVYGIFNTLWEPQNIEFWIVLIPIVSLAVALRLARRQTPRWARAAAGTLIALLFVANLLGSVLPQTGRRGDYWYAANAYLIHEATPDDLIVTDGGWISDNCLRAHTRAAVVVVREMPAQRLAEIIGRHRGGRIFISSWALRPDAAIVTTSPDWQRDEESLRRLFTSMRPRLEQLDDNGRQVIWQWQPE